MTNKRTAKPSAIKAPRPTQSRAPKASTKMQTCLDLLGRKAGAGLSELMAATSWQAHSVRGFLSGTVKKRFGHSIITSRDNDGGCRYRIDRANRGR